MKVRSGSRSEPGSTRTDRILGCTRGGGWRRSGVLRRALGALMLALGLVAGDGAGASTVLQATVGQMLARCELVFEGRVLREWVGEDPAHGTLHTWIRFQVLDVVKGSWNAPTLDLRFMGGQLGERREEIVGLHLPAVGEQGIYFVESLHRFQVNPLFGWDQGRLRIVRDTAGVARVVTPDGRPVVGLGQAALPPGTRLSSGVAAGVLVDPAVPVEQATTPAALKATLRLMLGGRP